MKSVAPSSKLSKRALDELFASFSQETERLERGYLLLQEQFRDLEKRLENSQRTLDRMISHISQGFIFINALGCITFYNRQAALITGLPPQYVLGRSFWELFADDIFGFSVKEALEQGCPPQMMALTMQTEGQTREIKVSISLLPAEEGTEGVILLLEDLTETRLLKQALQRNARLKELGEMAASLAHEIRNPLTAIEGFSSLLRDDLKHLPKASLMIEHILDGTRILNRLVSNVLDYSRPLTLKFLSTEINTLVKKTIVLSEAKESARVGRCTLSGSLPRSLSTDPDLIQMALLNLINNAFEASPPSSPISIELHHTAESAFIRVVDQGAGIPLQDQEKIFTPFFTTKAQGSGLGLSQVYKVMQAHGGCVEVASEESLGTTVTLKFNLL